jgi:3-hydroxybutyryl-CoA dehydrogenase
MAYYCANCNKYWNHEVRTCIFCGADTTKTEESIYRVLSSTKVHVPSKGNENVPYFVYLLEDRNGQKVIRKSDHSYQVGDEVNLDVAAVSRYAVGVIGSGLMGTQIAEYMVQTGYPVILKTRSPESIEGITSKIRKKLSKRLQEQEVERCLENLIITTDYSDLNNVDIIIEASKEDLEIKKEVFSELSRVCKPTTIFATNSSSLSIDALAEVTDRPERFIGLHFFNPVHRMDLVEVVIGSKTSNATKEFAVNLANDLKKQPIVVKNSPGFIVNRLLLPQINEAIRLLGDGIASREDIDSAVKLGLNHPMGPFELADFIGLDTCLSILEVLHTGLGDDHFEPAPLLREMVEEGKLGYKSGEGFYTY